MRSSITLKSCYHWHGTSEWTVNETIKSSICCATMVLHKTTTIAFRWLHKQKKSGAHDGLITDNDGTRCGAKNKRINDELFGLQASYKPRWLNKNNVVAFASINLRTVMTRPCVVLFLLSSTVSPCPSQWFTTTFAKFSTVSNVKPSSCYLSSPHIN